MRALRVRRCGAWALAVSLAAVANAATAVAADVATISSGGEVSLVQNLVPGKLVVFDFYADWCGPCRTLGPKLDDLATRHPDRIALRKVNIDRWGSPVAEQYRIKSIPHLKLYDSAGALISQGSGWDVLRDLERALEGGRVSGGAQQVGAPKAAFEDSATPNHVVPLFVFGAIALALMAFFARGLFPSAGRRAPAMVPAAFGPADPEKVWYARPTGRPLDGPFTPAELATNAAGFGWPLETPVRRKGDPGWRTLGEVTRS